MALALVVAGLAAGCGGGDASDSGASPAAGAGGSAGKATGGAGKASSGAGGAGTSAGGSAAGGGQAGSAQAGSSGGGSSQAGAGQGGEAGSAGQGGSAQAGSGGSAQAGEAGSAGSGAGGEAQAGSGGQGSGGAGASAGAGAAGNAPSAFLDKYPLTAQFPEGGVYDPVGHAFYVGSLKGGAVRRVDAATGAESVVFSETAPGKWWSLGMDVDIAKRRLWVCAMDDRSPDPRAGYVWVFDLTTGERIANHALDKAAAEATCTDVGLTNDGRGFVGDRELGNLYEVDLAAGPSLFVSNPTLKADFVGQNAIVVLPDQSAVLSLLYGPPAIVRVDLASKAVKKVDIDGSFFDFSLLAGADGMAYANGSVYVMFSSELTRVTPTLADWSAGSAQSVDVPNGMTDIVATPNGLYMLNGQAIRFATGETPDPFALVRFTGTL